MYEIIWSNDASNDYYKILEWWKINNGTNTYSIKIMSEVTRVEDLLHSNPYLGTKLSNQSRRIVILHNYSISYDVRENVIEILSFYDNRQDKLND
ncbi:MAG: type II toxin-antitoxin system RelE/ParE family toxin [Flavobacteriaceae bacterium]|nr:type II toxin-antitoxin system RelE/ParE family toxin [Flavobacteriaceae bacterium]